MEKENERAFPMVLTYLFGIAFLFLAIPIVDQMSTLAIIIWFIILVCWMAIFPWFDK